MDIENNIVYVCDKDSEELLSQDILVKDWTWIAEEYQENVALT
nr:hypothetical protein [bacterium]